VRVILEGLAFASSSAVARPFSHDMEIGKLKSSETREMANGPGPDKIQLEKKRNPQKK
jgi:hypothetical protein